MKELLIKNQNTKQVNTQIYNKVIQNTYYKRSIKSINEDTLLRVDDITNS